MIKLSNVLLFFIFMCSNLYADERSFSTSINSIEFNCHACVIRIQKADVSEIKLNIKASHPYTDEKILTTVSKEGKKLTINSTSEKDTRVDFTLIIPISHNFNIFKINTASLSLITVDNINVESWDIKTATIKNSTISSEFRNLFIKAATIKSSVFRYVGPTTGNRIAHFSTATNKSFKLFIPKGFTIEDKIKCPTKRWKKIKQKFKKRLEEKH